MTVRNEINDLIISFDCFIIGVPTAIYIVFLSQFELKGNNCLLSTISIIIIKKRGHVQWAFTLGSLWAI